MCIYMYIYEWEFLCIYLYGYISMDNALFSFVYIFKFCHMIIKVYILQINEDFTTIMYLIESD